MSDDEKPKIFQFGTVPPPAGEADAYNAPTKVGPMAAQIAELINAATERAAKEKVTAPPPPGAAEAHAVTTAPPPATASGGPPAFDGETRIVTDDSSEAASYDFDAADAAEAEAAAASAPPPEADVEPEAEPEPPSEPARAAEPEPARAAEPEPEPLPVVEAPVSERPSYSDPIAHTRPEWASVSKSEPKLPAAAAAPNRTRLVVAVLVVVFGLLGLALLIFGRR